jgi:MarR family transcriptional regulator for hemolysin
MSGCAQRETHRSLSTPDRGAALGRTSFRLPSGEPTVDQLLAEPIVRQLMRRDRIDEATLRHLLQKAAAAQPALRADDDLRADDLYPIVRLLCETARLWRSRHDREVRAQLPGMSCARCAVLIHLAQHEGTHQVALARLLDVRSATLVRLLDGLEADGFIARIPDPNDRRAHVLKLTAKARPIIERVSDLIRKTDDDLRLGISKAEARQLRELLCRIRSNLADDPSRSGATAMRRRELANSHDPAAGGNGGWRNANPAKASP